MPTSQLMEFINDVGGDPLKPSLFELVAQEQLRDLLQPALKYVLSVSRVVPYALQFTSWDTDTQCCSERCLRKVTHGTCCAS